MKGRRAAARHADIVESIRYILQFGGTAQLDQHGCRQRTTIPRSLDDEKASSFGALYQLTINDNVISMTPMEDQLAAILTADKLPRHFVVPT